MLPNDDHMRAMERAHVKAWPATTTALVQGWLWRCSGGGSQRANSVSTVDFDGGDPDAALDAIEARYRAQGLPPRVQTFDLTLPTDLPDRLSARGYRETEATLTLFKRPEAVAEPTDVERSEAPTEDWLSVYLSAITENRRRVNVGILARAPGPRAFFTVRRDGVAISSALCVTGFGCAVVECVATAAGARRQGGAERAMRALESWARGQGVDWIGLQVVATNTAARALYDRLGYVAGAKNRFWVREG